MCRTRWNISGLFSRPNTFHQERFQRQLVMSLQEDARTECRRLFCVDRDRASFREAAQGNASARTRIRSRSTRLNLRIQIWMCATYLCQARLEVKRPSWRGAVLKLTVQIIHLKLLQALYFGSRLIAKETTCFGHLHRRPRVVEKLAGGCQSLLN